MIEQIRKSKGVKLQAVANAVGVSRQTYSRYEKNPDLLTYGQARAIADFLGVKVSDIFLPAKVSKTNPTTR